jgi:hypothetical protein
MRVGVVGLKMGLYLATWCREVGMEVVAACDRDPERRAAAREQLPGAVLTERWQDLLEHGLDGVVLANDFDAHAPLAIAFLERGVYVLSEAAACVDHEEGRQLVAAVERSSANYSFAENYVFHPHVRVIQQAIDAGELGRIVLIEADYLHGMSPEAVAAKRRAIDVVRREARRAGKEAEAVSFLDPVPEPAEVVRDDLLRLVFTCCHPALSTEAHVALARGLRTCAGPGDERPPVRAPTPPPRRTAQVTCRHPAPGRISGIERLHSRWTPNPDVDGEARDCFRQSRR